MAKITIQIDESIAADTGKRAADAPVLEQVIHALRSVYDPELPVNVYDLGLIYDVKITDSTAHIDMTLTAPNCPVADKIPADVKAAAENVTAINQAIVTMVWQPKWDKSRMSEAAKLELGIF